jgi:hypothetical protein
MAQRRARKTNHMASVWVAALVAACDPNGHADAGRCPRVCSATQTVQTGRSNASVWVARLEMSLGRHPYIGWDEFDTSVMVGAMTPRPW